MSQWGTDIPAISMSVEDLVAFQAELAKWVQDNESKKSQKKRKVRAVVREAPTPAPKEVRGRRFARKDESV